jgi:hypothetical protein
MDFLQQEGGRKELPSKQLIQLFKLIDNRSTFESL